MAHFSENPSVRTGDTLDCKQRAIGVKCGIHRRIAVQVHILGSNLSVFCQLFGQFFRSKESAFTVGNGNIYNISHIHQAQPWALIRSDPGSYDPALVAANGIEGQGGASIICIHDLAIRNKAQFNQRLESVTNTAHQTIPLFQKFGNLLFDGRIAEEGCDKLCRTVRLIATGKTAGNKDHLALSDLLCHRFHAAGNIISSQVANHRNLCLTTCCQNHFGRIVLTVCTGKYGDQHFRLCTFHHRCNTCALFVAKHRDHLISFHGFCGINIFQHIGIPLVKLGDRGGILFQCNCAIVCGFTNFHHTRDCYILVQLCNNKAPEGSTVPITAQFGAGTESDTVTKRHFGNGFAQAVFHCPSSLYLSLQMQLIEGIPGIFHTLCTLIHRTEHIDGMSCRLKFRRQNLLCIHRCNCKGDQRRRYIQIEETTGHGVLTADRSSSQLQLCIQCTKQRCKGFSPTIRLCSQFFKELLKCQVGIMIICAGCHQFGNRSVDRCSGTGIGIQRKQIRIAAPGHHTGLIGSITGQNRKLCCHCLRRRCLIFTAKGHQHRTCANCSIKPFNQTALAGCFQVRCHFFQRMIQRLAIIREILFRNTHIRKLYCAICIQEISGKVSNLLTIPGHNHSGCLGNLRHTVGFQVFFLRQSNKVFCVLSCNYHSHTLLRLGDCQLCTIQSLILFTNCIQINPQAVCQLANSNTDTTGTKVVAPFNQAGNRRIAEQPL